MEPNTNAMQLYLDNRPRNVQRTSRLLSTLLMLAVLPLWPTLSFAGVEALLTDDAYTSSSSPAKKFGKKKGLLVSKSQRSFLKFSLSTLPSGTVGADVEKATLKLFASKRRKAGAFDVFAVTGPWSERRITHRTAPVLADHAETAAPVSVGGVNQFVTVDVTTLVRDWIDFIATSGASGRANNGVALVRRSRLSAEIDSKESDSTAHDAALEIVLTGGGGVGPAGPQGAAGPAGPVGPAGPQGLAWQGNFSSSTNYNPNDTVHDDGSIYLCVNALGCAASSTPAGNSSWSLVVERGETGPAGAPGAQGPAGPPGVSALEVVTAASGTTVVNPKTETVSCPAGKHALGGGGSLASSLGANAVMTASQPTGSPPTGWSVTGINLLIGTWSVTAYVICATVP
jgi:hypothetical protein